MQSLRYGLGDYECHACAANFALKCLYSSNHRNVQIFGRYYFFWRGGGRKLIPTAYPVVRLRTPASSTHLSGTQCVTSSGPQCSGFMCTDSRSIWIWVPAGIVHWPICVVSWQCRVAALEHKDAPVPELWFLCTRRGTPYSPVYKSYPS